MALELRQQLKLTQKLVMTQQLRQAIKLLQLNRLELSDALQAEIEQNPALEEDITFQDKLAENTSSLSSTTETTEPGPESDVTEGFKVSDSLGDVNWEDYSNNFDSNFSFAKETPSADAPSQFEFISEKPGLLAYLQWQLAHSDLDEGEWDVARYVIGNLNRYGFLEIEIEDIMKFTGCAWDDAEYIVEVIQDLDPPGICARNVSESLYLQLERMGKENSLAAIIVRDHLPLLETRNYKALSRATGKRSRSWKKRSTSSSLNLLPTPGYPTPTTTRIISFQMYT